MPIDPQIPLQARVTAQPLDPIQTLHSVMALKSQEQAQRIQQMQLEEAERQQGAQRALDEAWRTIGPKPDPQAIAQRLAESGYGHLVPGVIKAFTEMDAAAENARKVRLDNSKTQTEILAAAQDAYGAAAAQVKPYLSGEDKGLPAAKLAIDNLVGNGLMRAEDGQQKWEELQANPALLPVWVDSLIRGSKTYSQLETQRTQAARPVAVGSGGLADPATGRVIVPPTPKAATPPQVGSFEDYVVQKYGPRPTPEQMLEARGDYTKKEKPGGTGALTEAGVEYAATQYRVTGVMPPMGIGNSEGRAAIISQAAEQAKLLRQKPAEAIQRQAAYAADRQALGRMRVMASSAEAFETKALGQSQIVLELSEKVDRAKWPIINRIIVEGKKEVLGDRDAQLLTNAITTYTTEYAKIMEGSMGSVAASSDAARKAASELISAKLNKGTLRETVSLMNREMALTRDGYDATIKHITERMIGPLAPDATATAPPASGGIVVMRAPDGRELRVPQADVGKAKALGAVEVGGQATGKVAMTREKAAAIIQRQTGKAANAAQIDWFLKTYPYEQ